MGERIIKDDDRDRDRDGNPGNPTNPNNNITVARDTCTHRGTGDRTIIMGDMEDKRLVARCREHNMGQVMDKIHKGWERGAAEEDMIRGRGDGTMGGGDAHNAGGTTDWNRHGKNKG